MANNETTNKKNNHIFPIEKHFLLFFVTILNSSVQIVQTLFPDICINFTRHLLCTVVPHEQGDASKHGSKQI